jgi:hypothetical protein
VSRLEIRFSAADVISAGALAGAVMAAFLIVLCGLFVEVNAVFQPLRMVAAMILGTDALDPGYSLAVATATGFMLHMSLSVLFAFVFTACVNPLWRPGWLAAAGILFGTGLWLINFYVIANLLRWTWFMRPEVAVVSFVGHAFLYGCLLGWSLSAARPLIEART